MVLSTMITVVTIIRGILTTVDNIIAFIGDFVTVFNASPPAAVRVVCDRRTLGSHVYEVSRVYQICSQFSSVNQQSNTLIVCRYTQMVIYMGQRGSTSAMRRAPGIALRPTKRYHQDTPMQTREAGQVLPGPPTAMG